MTAHAMKWLLVAAALTFTPVVDAQTAPARENADYAKRAYGQGLLWKIENASGQSGYFFGTIHVADPRVLALPAAVRASFDQVGSFAMEVALDTPNLSLLAQRMLLTDGRDLEQVVGPALYAKLAASAPSVGLPVQALRRLKPWAVALILLIPQQNGEAVLDDRLYRMAVEQQKAVHQLETIDEQVELFDSMREGEQVALLRHAIENRERLPKLIGQMVDTYLKRDLAGLYRISRADDDDPALRQMTDAFMQRLLDERNVRMAERADALLKKAPVFVAVGALHLYGERGVLALLASRGYKVTRVY